MHHWTKTNYNKRGVRLSFKREFILFGCAIIALSGLTISAPTPGVAQATCQTCGKAITQTGFTISACLKTLLPQWRAERRPTSPRLPSIDVARLLPRMVFLLAEWRLFIHPHGR